MVGEKEQVGLFVAVHSVLALQFAQSLKASGFTVLLILKPRLCEPCWLLAKALPVQHLEVLVRISTGTGVKNTRC